MTAPGYPLSRALRELPEEVLDGLLRGSHRLVEVLLKTELSSEEKVDFLLRLRGAEDLLKDREALERIVAQLPSEKQRELTERIGGRPGKKRLTASQERAILSFFGAARGSGRQDSVGSSRANMVEPVYGLFEHQRDALVRTRELLEGYERRVVLHMPTGAGKTRTAMHLVASHFREAEPTVVVWLAHSYELLEQAAEDFEVAWRSLGNRPLSVCRFWSSGGIDPLAEKDSFIVAGLGKMHRWSQDRLDDFLRLADRTTLTVMDEAHQSVARTYRQVLEGLATKRVDGRLLGLTATPGRTWSDLEADRELAGFFRGNKVVLSIKGYRNPVDYLMEEGYLAKPRFRTLNSGAGFSLSDEDRESLRKSLDVPEKILGQLGEWEERNLRVLEGIEDLLQNHRRILVFAVGVDHAKLIAATLSAKGEEAFCITGETPKSEREHWIKRFRSNLARPLVLVNYGVLTTGFDAPGASAALIARPTKSLVLFSQMVGRVIRGPKAGGNESCEVVTVVDPSLPGFGSVAEAFTNWEDVWG